MTRALLEGSAIRQSHVVNDERVQDPYSLRCQPQVMGACRDLIAQAARTLLIEANAVTDNPLVFAEDGAMVSGGNFHAEPVALAADAMGHLGLVALRAHRDGRSSELVAGAARVGLRPAGLSLGDSHVFSVPSSVRHALQCAILVLNTTGGASPHKRQ